MIDDRIGIAIEKTDKNIESLTKLAMEMTRRICPICKMDKIPYCRCLICKMDVCEDCTGKKEVPHICIGCLK